MRGRGFWHGCGREGKRARDEAPGPGPERGSEDGSGARAGEHVAEGEQLAVLASDCHVHTDQAHPDWGTTHSQVHVITVATGALELLHVEPRISSWDLAWRP